jgi:hypothetical protein
METTEEHLDADFRAEMMSSIKAKYKRGEITFKEIQQGIGHTIKEPHGGVLLHYAPKQLDPSLLDNFEQWCSSNLQFQSCDDVRGPHQAAFLGHWTSKGGKTADKVYPTPLLKKQKHLVNHLKQFNALWTGMCDPLSKAVPGVVKLLEKVGLCAWMCVEVWGEHNNITLVRDHT